MNVQLRNLLRLLRAGAFDSQEQLEPLSPHKWRKLYVLAQKHGVASYVDKGMGRTKEQFFLQLPENMPPRMKKEKSESLSSELKLTNPMLKHALKKIEDEEEGDSDKETLQLLRQLIAITTSILSTGIPLQRLIQLGLSLRAKGRQVDFDKLQQWTERLHMQRMMQLIGQLLVSLFHFTDEEVPFAPRVADSQMDAIIEEMFQHQDAPSSEWMFEQGDGNIFVHTSNSSALFWQVRHSARYFRYYPSESITHFFSSFLRSLQNIEE